MKEIMDGNQATATASYLFTEVATIYPITPSSPMADNIDIMANKGEKNIFNDKVLISEMESEAGAAGALHGALLSGSLASTYTASQGLLLMIPNMYKIAGEGLPGVIHTASRTVATHALSIFGDHSDVYAIRDTGFNMLASNNPQECYHMALVAHLSAIASSLPFIHFFDGFRTSHELNVVETLERKDILNLVDKEKIKEFKNKSMNLHNIKQHGMSETEDIYFQSMEARNKDYDRVPDIVNSYMGRINKLAGTDYKPFNYYGASDAKYVIIAMGSVVDTIKLVIDKENKHGEKFGVISVHLYRPFSKKYLENVLPSTVERIAVLDMVKDQGSIGEPLYLDVLSALKDKNLTIVGGRYGLSSKNTTPEDIYGIYSMLMATPKNNFTISIKDDLTHTSISSKPYDIKLDANEIKIYGYGSDGMVSASKDIMYILGENSYVQGYFEYDSKKSGGVTISNLRISNKKIEAPYYVNNADIIVVTKDSYFTKYHCLDDIKDNGTLLINTSDPEKCISSMYKEDIDIIENKHIKVLVIDANRIAEDNNIRGKISKIMEIIILKLLGVKDPLDILNKSIYNAFYTKGEDIVNNNQNAIKEALNSTKRITIESSNNNINRKEYSDLIDLINARKGDNLTTSEVYKYRNGEFPGGLTSKEKRSVSDEVPKWNKDNCIQCGMCSLVCPHAAIRPFLVNDNDGIKAIGAPEYHYMIVVSERDCLGCGLCVSVCPGKQGNKALTLGKPTYESDDKVNRLFNNYTNPDVFDKFTIKGSQLIKPKFEFSGACAGCGETAYIKLLTQLFGDQIVICNATGCSSIYGGSTPSTPYSLPWANSLFEDNAEFAYGMHLSYKNKRERLKELIRTNIDELNKDEKQIYNDLLNNFDNYDITHDIYNKLSNITDLPEDFKELLPYVEARKVVALGGDGWAYDIGFNGIDHVLSSEENIKVMVLDTEVYSNTGGQMSKSSHIGQVCEFAGIGKHSHKKDLFRIAMSYPNCYVASICIGGNMFQAIRSIKEAMEHDGPALIICYAPCIEHGIKGGMSCSIQEEKLAVECGYTLLMRYSPNENKLYLDSKNINFDKYDSFLNNEVRYRSLKLKNKEDAEELLELNKNASINRYNYYKKLENENNN